MRRRFWIAVGTGAVVGGGAVLSFAPVVRSQIQDRASRYGATVEVDSVVPTWAGIRLSGVEVTIEDIPGVTVSLDEVVVGWDKKPVSTSGGKIVAVGALATLVSDAQTWKDHHLKGGGEGGARRKIGIEDFAVEWKNATHSPSRSVAATGVAVSKEGPLLSASAATFQGKYLGAQVDVTDGALDVVKGERGFRIVSMTTAGLSLSYEGGNREIDMPAKESPSEGTAEPAGVHPRIMAARRARSYAQALALRLQEALDPDAIIALDGAAARLGFGEDVLHLGPGRLSLARADGDIVLALEPSAAAPPRKPGEKALTFSARLPYADTSSGAAPEERAVQVEVHGGPVWLSMLGVHEGDFGLRNVHETRIEADVVVELPPGEQTLSVEGRGRVQELAIMDERLAPKPLEGVELAWQSKIDVRLDGTELSLHETELDLGDIRFQLSGTWKREGEHHQVAVDYAIPLMTCERAFDSIPKALVPKLEGMHFAGSLSLEGHARFDTANIKKNYDVDWDGTLSCRVTHAPPEVAVSRFKNSFEKVVYSPTREERMMTFGPNTDTWVSHASIAHYMSGSVLVTEDGRFHRHRGFDKEAIVNSIQQNIEARRFVRGASTISMQLAKNLYLPRTKTLSRKLQEAVLTLYLEQELTKREMMELYLNVIEYGPMIYGIGPAARHYFNSHPGRLSVTQAMYLASILRNPKKQFFGGGGAVIGSHMRTLHLYIKILHKIGRITEEELARGRRETVIFGSPAPMVKPEEDEDGYPLDEGTTGSDAGPTQEANAGF